MPVCLGSKLALVTVAQYEGHVEQTCISLEQVHSLNLTVLLFLFFECSTASSVTVRSTIRRLREQVEA